MTRELAGRCLVLTRPRGQGEQLEALLHARGATVLQFPVTEILPLEDQSALLALARRLDEFSVAFFVSANAVRHFVSALPVATWPGSLRFATVGPASARALREAGVAEVIFPRERFDSEGVLALPAFQADAVAGRKVLILRGDGGRELVADTLFERGAQVEYLQCYQRRCACVDAAPLRAQSPLISGIVFSASEAIQHFCQILGDAAPEMLASVPVFVPHPRIAVAAERAGARQVVLTGAGDEGIVAGIIHHQW